MNSMTSTPGNILLIDDTPENLLLLSKLLIHKGYEVRAVTSGSMALTVIQAEPPELILLDVRMPNMDGYCVCQALKANPETCYIPVIFISAIDDVKDKVKAFEIGGVDYITKPFHSAEVIVRVHTHLSLRRLQVALESANQTLQQLANSDGLTKIANRRYFDEYAQQQWQRLQSEKVSCSLILCDIDYFKLYNDTYGHLMGDDSLRQVAQAIQNTVIRPGALVARYGGEEFAIILPNTCNELAIKTAQAIQNSIQQLNINHALSPTSHLLTLSLGIATTTPSSKNSLKMLIDLADKALYTAKQQGRNTYCLPLTGNLH